MFPEVELTQQKPDQDKRQEEKDEEEPATTEDQNWSTLGSEFDEELFESSHDRPKQSRSQKRQETAICSEPQYTNS